MAKRGALKKPVPQVSKRNKQMRKLITRHIGKSKVKAGPKKHTKIDKKTGKAAPIRGK